MHLIVGSSLEALRRCETTESVLIYPDYVPDFSPSDTPTEWDSLFLTLAITGKVLFNQKVKSLRIFSDFVTVYLSSGDRRKLEFNLCEVYNTDGVTVECTPLESAEALCHVYDYFTATSFSDFPTHTHLTRPGMFVSDVWFCKSPKIVTMSTLSPEQIVDIEYSDIYSRFELLSELRKLGYLGKRNGLDSLGRQKYLGLALETVSRDVRLIKKEKYSDVERVKFRD